MRRWEARTLVTRVAAALAVVLAVVLVGLVMLGGSGSYEVRARFINAGQVVDGGLVQIGGVPAGEITKLRLTQDGQAELSLKIDDEHAPLPAGTRAEIRRVGLSGPASRYVHLELPNRERGEEIADGGLIGTDRTTSLVDLDQFFGIFDERTRRALRGVIRGSARQYAAEGGRFGHQAARGWRYLDPAIVASTRLFEELNRDTPQLERFLVQSSRLVGDLASQREHLAGLVDHLADTTNAIARPRALDTAIRELPPFMRRANTTYVNLRAALDDLDALVRDARPGARRLPELVRELRLVSEELRPTVGQLSTLIRRPGRDNDLLDASRATLPLREIAVGPVERNGERRPGALEATGRGALSATDRISTIRPYVVDIAGWFDDYSHSGLTDALGGFARIGSTFNAYSFREGTLSPLAPSARGSALRDVAALGRNNRCPGSMERDVGDDSNPWKPHEDFICDPTSVPLGP